MTAYQKDTELQSRFIHRFNKVVHLTDCNALRRAALTLHRWGELECGDGNDYASWSIERDEETNVPYRCVYPHQGTMRKYRIADREAGALKRIKRICDANGLHFYYQTDPRGWPLYVSIEPLTDQNYNNGVGIGN